MITRKIPFQEVKRFLALPEEALKFLEFVRNLSREKGNFLYLAGGPVRDFLLNKPVKDLDLVLEGNWEELLKEIFENCKATLLFKSPFLTYKIKLSENFTIDLVTARKESYPEPARLPVIEPSNFKEDVFRRDFTVNALIYGLTPPYEETLIDLVKGFQDLQEGLIRPLHVKSFIDDPTRVLRGIRYKVRLRFEFAEEFYSALYEAEKASSFKKLSPSRLANELLLFFYKERFEDLPLLIEEICKLRLFEKFGLILRKISTEDYEILSLARGELQKRDLEKFFLLFLIDINVENLERLGFQEREKMSILQFWERVCNNERFLKLDIPEKVEVLEKLPPYLIFRLCLEKIYMPFILKFLKELRYIKPELSGKDLLSMGIKEGEKIGKILKEIRKKKIMGELKNKEEEISFVKTLIFQGF